MSGPIVALAWPADGEPAVFVVGDELFSVSLHCVGASQVVPDDVLRVGVEWLRSGQAVPGQAPPGWRPQPFFPALESMVMDAVSALAPDVVRPLNRAERRSLRRRGACRLGHGLH